MFATLSFYAIGSTYEHNWRHDVRRYRSKD